MKRPKRSLSDPTTRVVLAVYQGAQSVREIAKASGLAVMTTYTHIAIAKEHGLIVDLADKAGNKRWATIRPNARIVRVCPPRRR